MVVANRYYRQCQFTGQARDTETGLDFFQARYYRAALGRFTSPDPGNAGADLYHPQSWNAYAYVLGNPLSATDPSGLCGGIDAGISSDPYHGGGLALLQLAYQYGFDIAYPYAGQSKFKGVLNVFAQSLGFKTGASNTASAMRQDVIAQSGNSTSLFAGWSGGAVAMQLAGVDPQNSSAAQVYFSPGGAVLPNPTQNQNALVFSGSGVMDSLVNATSSGPLSNPNISYPGTPGCGPDAACMWAGHEDEIDNLIRSNNVQSCPSPTVFLPGGIRKPLSSFFPGGGGGATGGSSGGQWIFFQPTYYGSEGISFGPGSWVWWPSGGSQPMKVN